MGSRPMGDAATHASGITQLAEAAGPVDLALVLAVDCSGSVDDTDFGIQMAGIAAAFRNALPNLTLAQDAAIKQEEAKLRAKLEQAGKEAEGQARAPIVNTATYGRNDTVTIKKGAETQTLKYKKAEAMLADGWAIIESTK